MLNEDQIRQYFEKTNTVGDNLKEVETKIFNQKEEQKQLLEEQRRAGLGKAFTTPELLLLASKSKKEKQPKTWFLPGTFKDAPWNKAYYAVKSFFIEKKYALYFLAIAKFKFKMPKVVSKNKRHGVDEAVIVRNFLQGVHQKHGMQQNP